MINRIFLYLAFAALAFGLVRVSHAQQTPDTYHTLAEWKNSSVESLCSTVVASRGPSWYPGKNVTGAYAVSTGPGGGFCQAKVDGVTTSFGQYITSMCPVTKPSFNGTQCVVPDVPPSCAKPPAGGRADWATTDANGVSSGRSVITTGGCMGGCTVDIQEVIDCYSVPPSKQRICTLRYVYTGTECSGQEPSPAPAPGEAPKLDQQMPPTTPPPGKGCPEGSVQGGVDSAGTPICIGTGTNPQNAPPPPPKITSEKTTQNADGSTTKTTTETTTNSDGSKTTVVTNVTTMPDGSTKTDTSKNTGNNSAGGAGKDESAKDDEKYDLCKQNPMLNICRNSSVSGTCGEVTCQGDAIQCATLRAAAAMECRSKKQEEDFLKRPEIAAGQQILDGNDPLKGEIDRVLKGESVDFGAENLDQSGFLGGGACLAPRTFTVMGQAVTVSFDSMCSNIQPLRYLVLSCAFILAYLIVSRAALEA